MSRGRPALTMTHQRRAVLNELMDARQKGERVTLSHIARRCGLYDYRDARRIVSDLERMGINTPCTAS